MENYILSLIKENNRVIVPNFGAFIVAKENGFSVLFNNFLSFNDGLLVDHIIKEENIGRDEAEKKIDEYVEMVKAKLDENGTYNIPQLGAFTKDATGILRFEQSEDLNKGGLPSTETVSADNDESLLDIDPTDEITEETHTSEVSTSETNLNKTTPIAEFEEPKPVFEQSSEKIVSTPVFEDEDQKVEKEESTNQDTVAIDNRYLEEDNTKRNRSVAIFLMVILIPLIGFTIYFFFFQDNSPEETKEKLSSEMKRTEPQKVPVEPTIAAGQIDAGPSIEKKEQPAEKPVEKVVTELEPDVKKPHQLIVGSFSSEVNANKMVDNLKQKGYDQAFSFAHNNRHLVSLESFAKVYEAQARQEQILQSDKMESWIITKR